MKPTALIAAALLLACSDSQDVSVPAEWVAVTSVCGFTFMAPPDIVSVEVGGDDSCGETWSLDSCRLQGERTTIAGPGPVVETEELLDFEQSSETIDGRAAQITTARHQRFPETPFFSSAYFAADESRPAMAVWAFCSSEIQRDETLQLLRSVTTSDAPLE